MPAPSGFEGSDAPPPWETDNDDMQHAENMDAGVEAELTEELEENSEYIDNDMGEEFDPAALCCSCCCSCYCS